MPKTHLEFLSTLYITINLNTMKKSKIIKPELFIVQIIIGICTFIGLSAKAQGTWVQKNAIFNGCYTQSNANCTIGNKAYVGMGPQYCFDWWQYDPIADVYVQKANFPDTTDDQPAVFSISGYCYVLSHGNRLWKYDPINDTWTNTGANFPGASRFASYYFSIGSKGYVGGGGIIVSPYTALQDFWEYNSILNQWTSLANLPVANKIGEAFSVNGNGYITGGQVTTGSCGFTMNVYEYDPASLLWTTKNNTPDGRYAASSFVIGNDAYLGMGLVCDTTALSGAYKVFKYDNVADSWLPITDIPTTVLLDEGVGFALNGKGYMGLGDCGDFNLCGSGTQQRIFEYTPATTGIADMYQTTNSIYLFPNPFSTQTTLQTDNLFHNATLTVDNCFGQPVKQIKNISGQSITLHRDNLPSGLYFLQISQCDKIFPLHKLVITDN